MNCQNYGDYQELEHKSRICNDAHYYVAKEYIETNHQRLKFYHQRNSGQQHCVLKLHTLKHEIGKNFKQQPKVFSFFDRLYDVQIGFFNLHIVGPCESEAIRTIDTSQDNKRETGVHLKPKEPFIDQHCLAYQVLIIYGFDSKVVKICLLEAHDKRDLKVWINLSQRFQLLGPVFDNQHSSETHYLKLIESVPIYIELNRHSPEYYILRKIEHQAFIILSVECIEIEQHF
ncbi:hypothetical protein LTR10_002188 [Elasticomyces elasticus]|nr:hypothetical protein LTR10_002188 [Elasticomyces elasticus]